MGKRQASTTPELPALLRMVLSFVYLGTVLLACLLFGVTAFFCGWAAIQFLWR